MKSSCRKFILFLIVFYVTVSKAIYVNAQGIIDNTSKVPKYDFSMELTEQEKELESNSLMLRFKASREKLFTDPHRPIFHFANPEGKLNDPNGLCYWQGRWHLFYQGYPPEDPRQHWGHAVSEDLVHWKDLPYAIYPGPEKACFSGATYVENDRVIAMYHGRGLGNMVAVADDPLLLNWEKISGTAVISSKKPLGEERPYNVYDPCIWKKGDYYYSLSGGRQPGPGDNTVRAHYLFKSKNLTNWEYLHPFVENDRFTSIMDDGACPYFWPIADKHILIFFSHLSGPQYLVGDYDLQRNKFIATSSGKFNFGWSWPSGVQAPSAFPDGNGGIISIFNMNAGKPKNNWNDNQIMTLPIRLSLESDEHIRITPAANMEVLRTDHRSLKNVTLPANQDMLLDSIQGNAIEIFAEVDLKDAQSVDLDVLRAPGAKEYTRLTIYKVGGFGYPRHEKCFISIDGSRSSLSADIESRIPETTSVEISDGQTLKLRIFIDKSVVEVFANEQKYMAMRVFPTLEESIGISFRSQGQESILKSFDVWQMDSIWEIEK